MLTFKKKNSTSEVCLFFLFGYELTTPKRLSFPFMPGGVLALISTLRLFSPHLDYCVQNEAKASRTLALSFSCLMFLAMTLL